MFYIINSDTASFVAALVVRQNPCGKEADINIVSAVISALLEDVNLSQGVLRIYYY